MSFPRAPLKRFNERVGCAPPPGTYDLKCDELKGAASFHKAERFKSAAKLAPPAAKDVPLSPVRRTMSVDGLTDGPKKDSSFQTEKKHQKLLEKEIRLLIQQRGEQDRRLQALEEELRKLEAKLLTAVREKTGLNATVASLERQLAELKKTNEFLKSKVSADTTKKRMNSLSMELMEVKNKLDAKDKELSFLQISSEGTVQVLNTDLEASKVTLQTLKGRTKDLENLHEETKAQNEELEKEVDKLHVIIQGLRDEMKALQSYLDLANEEIQDLKHKDTQNKSTMERRVSDSQEELCELKQKLRQCTAEKHESQNVLKEKEQELQRYEQQLQDCRINLEERQRELKQREHEVEASQDVQKNLEEKLKQGELELKVSQNTIKQQEQELARVREVLRRTEDELDQRVALMTERCMNMEDEKARTQEEGLRRFQELLSDLSSLEESRNTEKAAHDQLKLQHASVLKELEEEKANTVSLSNMLTLSRDDLDKERKQLENELEEVLSELTLLEQKDQQREAALELLSDEKNSLEEQLNSTRAELQSTNAEMKYSAEIHQEVQRKLKEEHNSLLGKLGEMATDLERVKQDLGAQREQDEGRIQQLNEELENVKKQLLEEEQKLLQLQQTQDKERDEYARMLLEVQAKLVQSEVELRCSREVAEQEKKEKNQILVQLEQFQQRKRESAEGEEMKTSFLQKQVAELQEVQEKLHQEMQAERLRFSTQLEEAQKSSSNDEMEHWRNLYEQLYAKVKPFQEQLDGFAAERDALLSEKGATQTELNKLAGAYANLLGHQNQRQKIKHMVKLKEENLGLKQEISKLKVQVVKQKKELEQLKCQDAPRRFDPSKAFKHEHKENQGPLTNLR